MSLIAFFPSLNICKHLFSTSPILLCNTIKFAGCFLPTFIDYVEVVHVQGK